MEYRPGNKKSEGIKNGLCLLWAYFAFFSGKFLTKEFILLV